MIRPLAPSSFPISSLRQQGRAVSLEKSKTIRPLQFSGINNKKDTVSSNSSGFKHFFSAVKSVPYYLWSNFIMFTRVLPQVFEPRPYISTAPPTFSAGFKEEGKATEHKKNPTILTTVLAVLNKLIGRFYSNQHSLPGQRAAKSFFKLLGKPLLMNAYKDKTPNQLLQTVKEIQKVHSSKNTEGERAALEAIQQTLNTFPSLKKLFLEELSQQHQAKSIGTEKFLEVLDTVGLSLNSESEAKALYSSSLFDVFSDIFKIYKETNSSVEGAKLAVSYYFLQAVHYQDNLENVERVHQETLASWVQKPEDIATFSSAIDVFSSDSPEQALKTLLSTVQNKRVEGRFISVSNEVLKVIGRTYDKISGKGLPSFTTEKLKVKEASALPEAKSVLDIIAQFNKPDSSEIPYLYLSKAFTSTKEMDLEKLAEEVFTKTSGFNAIKVIDFNEPEKAMEIFSPQEGQLIRPTANHIFVLKNMEKSFKHGSKGIKALVSWLSLIKANIDSAENNHRIRVEKNTNPAVSFSPQFNNIYLIPSNFSELSTYLENGNDNRLKNLLTNFKQSGRINQL